MSRIAKEFPSPDALKNYLREHPKADPKNHSVIKSEKPEGKGTAPAGKGKGTGERKLPLSDDLKTYGDKASPKDLKPEHREEISDYNMTVVGEDGPRAVEIARKIKKGIEQSADICKMNPPLCKGNKGLTRDKMPQIEGEKSVKDMLASDKEEDRAKGKAMVQAGADPKSSKTVLGLLIDHLAEAGGIKTKQTKMAVGLMKATQSEIKASKVFGMADSYLKGKFDNIDDSVVVSKDGHILDGHHRWAALLTIDPGRKMNVKQIDMTMDELLKEAASFPGVYKANFKGEPLSESDQKKYKEENKSSLKGKGKKASGPWGSHDVSLRFGSNDDFDGSIVTNAGEKDTSGIVRVENARIVDFGGDTVTEVYMAGVLHDIRMMAPASRDSVQVIKSVRSLNDPDFHNGGSVPVMGTLSSGMMFKAMFRPSSYLLDEWSEAAAKARAAQMKTASKALAAKYFAGYR